MTLSVGFSETKLSSVQYMLALPLQLQENFCNVINIKDVFSQV